LLLKTSVKEKIKNGKLTIGSWISLAHPAIAEIMADIGFDWLVIDLEHSVISLREAEELIRIINLRGVTPLVRLTSNDSNLIKRVMDAGAFGIVVPMVNNREDAIQALSSMKYPPSGIRGVGLARAQGYGTKFKEYLDFSKKETILIVQIEHIDAVDNLEEILQVEGVDGYIVGPYDLSCSLGEPGRFDSRSFLKAIARIEKVAKKLGVYGGTHIVEPDEFELKKRIMDGQKFIAYSVDFRVLDSTFRSGLRSVESYLEK